MDLVSVIIPSYNRFAYLLNTIKSVKMQTYSNIEIIVVNDCSIENEYYLFLILHIKARSDFYCNLLHKCKKIEKFLISCIAMQPSIACRSRFAAWSERSLM